MVDFCSALLCCRRVSDRGDMKTHCGEVAVFVRIRPTANFAHGLIECPPDGQVNPSFNTTVIKTKSSVIKVD